MVRKVNLQFQSAQLEYPPTVASLEPAEVEALINEVDATRIAELAHTITQQAMTELKILPTQSDWDPYTHFFGLLDSIVQGRITTAFSIPSSLENGLDFVFTNRDKTGLIDHIENFSLPIMQAFIKQWKNELMQRNGWKSLNCSILLTMKIGHTSAPSLDFCTVARLSGEPV